MITKTFEPLRPIYAEHETFAPYYSDPMQSIGEPRVFYGSSTWASRSYWMVPNARTERD